MMVLTHLATGSHLLSLQFVNNLDLTPNKSPTFSQELHTYGMAVNQTHQFDSPAFFVVC